MTTFGILLAATLFSASQGGVDVSIEAESKVIDPARSLFLKVSATAKPGVAAEIPDLRERFAGFSLVEDFAEEPVTGKDGRVTHVVNWRLEPEPCAEVYKVKPFAVGACIAGPVYFDPPPPREPVTGGMEVEPKKMLPPLSWRLVGFCAAALAAAVAILVLLWLGIRFLLRKAKEHRMSPIERAWVELDRLLKKGLPGRGRYKDFYVELTMVVRRYVQRKYGIRAPHLTTEEFLAEIAGGGRAGDATALRRFLESADLVKFAGVEATPEMADEATASARGYLKSDDAAVTAEKGGGK